jgi:hypothetical protein
VRLARGLDRVPGSRGAVGAVAALVIIAGCGGSSHPTTLTHAQLVKRANAACATANAQAAQQSKPHTPAQLAALAGHLQQIAGTLISQLRSLDPSSADRAGYEKYLQDLRTGDHLLSQLRAAASSGNAARIRQVLAEMSSSPDDRDARAVGLAVCAEPISPQG